MSENSYEDAVSKQLIGLLLMQNKTLLGLPDTLLFGVPEKCYWLLLFLIFLPSAWVSAFWFFPWISWTWKLRNKYSHGSLTCQLWWLSRTHVHKKVPDKNKAKSSKSGAFETIAFIMVCRLVGTGALLSNSSVVYKWKHCIHTMLFSLYVGISTKSY